MQYIEGYLQQNYTQAQIIKQLEVLCALAPPSIAPLCDTFVEQVRPITTMAMLGITVTVTITVI